MKKYPENMPFQVERALTIEVDTYDGIIVQARGYGNRSPRAHEISALRDLANAAGFRINSSALISPFDHYY